MIGPIVVMGPAGCGKSTLGRLIADTLGRRFVEGDDLHPAANRERMARGQPLTDSDRVPFLDAVGEALASPSPPVASCSALKRAYRDRLRQRAHGVVFIHPVVPEPLLRSRMAERAGHFMPVSQVADQLATLEPLEEGEAGFTVDGGQPTTAQLAVVLERLAPLR